jgi:hypothetical protein
VSSIGSATTHTICITAHPEFGRIEDAFDEWALDEFPVSDDAPDTDADGVATDTDAALPKKRRAARVARPADNEEKSAEVEDDLADDEDEGEAIVDNGEAIVDDDTTAASLPESTAGSRASSVALPAPSCKKAPSRKKKRRPAPTVSNAAVDEDDAGTEPAKTKPRPRPARRASSTTEAAAASTTDAAAASTTDAAAASTVEAGTAPPANTPPPTLTRTGSPAAAAPSEDEPTPMFQLLPPSWLQEILEPLEEHADPRFRTLGSALDAFELAHQYAHGSTRGITTLGRPPRIGEWFRGGRGQRSTQLPALNADVFGKEVQDWLVAVRPAWLQDIPTTLTGCEDWGLMGTNGHNGVSLVARSVVWWSQASPDDERLGGVVEDLTWILRNATAAVTARPAALPDEEDASSDDEDSRPSPAPAGAQKRKHTAEVPASSQKRRR